MDFVANLEEGWFLYRLKEKCGSMRKDSLVNFLKLVSIKQLWNIFTNMWIIFCVFRNFVINFVNLLIHIWKNIRGQKSHLKFLIGRFVSNVSMNYNVIIQTSGICKPLLTKIANWNWAFIVGLLGKFFFGMGINVNGGY